MLLSLFYIIIITLCAYYNTLYMNYDIINYRMETSVCGDDKNMMEHSYFYSNNDINWIETKEPYIVTSAKIVTDHPQNTWCLPYKPCWTLLLRMWTTPSSSVVLNFRFIVAFESVDETAWKFTQNEEQKNAGDEGVMDEESVRYKNDDLIDNVRKNCHGPSAKYIVSALQTVKRGGTRNEKGIWWQNGFWTFIKSYRKL